MIIIVQAEHEPNGVCFNWIASKSTRLDVGQFVLAEHRNGGYSIVKVMGIRYLRQGEKVPCCKVIDVNAITSIKTYQRKQRAKRA